MFSQIFSYKYAFQILVFAVFCAVLALFVPHISLAQDLKSGMSRYVNAFAGEGGAGLSTPSDARTVVAKVIKAFLSILGILFLAYAVYAGYLIMSSGGEEEKIKKGKSTLITAAIGVLVIFSVYSILYFVLGLLAPPPAEEGLIFEANVNLDFRGP